MFLTLAGNDYYFVKTCLEAKTSASLNLDSRRPSEFQLATRHGVRWTAPGMKEFCDYIYSNIDGAMAVLPEYDIAARPYLGDRLSFTNIPLTSPHCPKYPHSLPATCRDRIRLFIGMRQGWKSRKALQECFGSALNSKKRCTTDVRSHACATFPLPNTSAE